MLNNSDLIHNILHHLSAVFGRECDQILQEQLGIGLAQYKILSALSDNPATQQREIAIALGQTEASISRQIKLLRAKGMLETRIRPENRRQHVAMLTAKGHRITEAAGLVLGNYRLMSLSRLTDRQQAQLLELLASIH